MFPQAKITVAEALKQLRDALQRDDRREAALLSRQLDDALLMEGRFNDSFATLLNLLRSDEFRRSGAAWHLLHVLSYSVDLMTDDECGALTPVAEALVSDVQDEMSKHLARELLTAVKRGPDR